MRILPDERTNSLLVLASRQQLADIRGLVRKLDIPVAGEGRIQVYYLRHADAEELSETLNSLVGSGGGGAEPSSSLPGAASNTQSIRSAVTPLDEGITVTADPATNALVIKASKEGYETLKQVIEKLDVSRPQVLVEALIVEVDVTDDLDSRIRRRLPHHQRRYRSPLPDGYAVVPGSGLAAAAPSNAASTIRETHFDPGAVATRATAAASESAASHCLG